MGKFDQDDRQRVYLNDTHTHTHTDHFHSQFDLNTYTKTRINQDVVSGNKYTYLKKIFNLLKHLIQKKNVG